MDRFSSIFIQNVYDINALFSPLEQELVCDIILIY